MRVVARRSMFEYGDCPGDSGAFLSQLFHASVAAAVGSSEQLKLVLFLRDGVNPSPAADPSPAAPRATAERVAAAMPAASDETGAPKQAAAVVSEPQAPGGAAAAATAELRRVRADPRTAERVVTAAVPAASGEAGAPTCAAAVAGEVPLSTPLIVDPPRIDCSKCRHKGCAKCKGAAAESAPSSLPGASQLQPRWTSCPPLSSRTSLISPAVASTLALTA